MFLTILGKNIYFIVSYLRWRLFAFVGMITIFFASQLFYTPVDTSFGLVFLGKLSCLLFFIFIVLTPMSCVHILERDKKTIDLLMLSHLKPSRLVLVKFTLSILVMIFYLCSLLPLYLMSYSFGGINPSQIVVLFIVLMTTIIFCAIFTIFICSLGSLSMNGAVLANVLLFIVLMICNDKFFPQIAITTWKSLNFCLEGKVAQSFSGIYLFTILASILFIITAKKFPWRMYAEKRRADKLDTIDIDSDSLWHDTSYQETALVTERKQKIKFFSNPVVWKDYFFLHYPKFLWQTQLLEGKDKIRFQFFIIVYIFTVYPLFFIISLLNAGTKAMVKESKTFELILTTKLSNEEIINGKLFAIAKGMEWNINIFFGLFIIPFFTMLASFVLIPGAIGLVICFSFFTSILLLAVSTSLFFAFWTMNTFFSLLQSFIFLVFSQAVLFYTIFLPDYSFMLPIIINLLLSYFFYLYLIKNLRSGCFASRLVRVLR